MRKSAFGVAAIVVLAAAGFAAYHWLGEQAPPPAPVAAVPATEPQSAPAAAEPAIRYPIAVEAATPPLPELGQSDASFLRAIGEAFGKKWLALINPDAVIHRFVATVDNLPRRQLPAAIVPFQRVPGNFLVTGAGETLATSAHNPERYLPYVQLIGSVDAAKLVALYRSFYPLFQRAYAELGYPQGYFNDRLVEAIDDLLAAPEIADPVALTQPKVLYEFADPELAQRSAGQKIMMRVGRDNAATIKAKLSEIRALVVRA